MARKPSSLELSIRETIAEVSLAVGHKLADTSLAYRHEWEDSIDRGAMLVDACAAMETCRDDFGLGWDEGTDWVETCCILAARLITAWTTTPPDWIELTGETLGTEVFNEAFNRG